MFSLTFLLTKTNLVFKVANLFLLKGAQSYFCNFFFELLEILLSQESSYFSFHFYRKNLDLVGKCILISSIHPVRHFPHKTSSTTRFESKPIHHMFSLTFLLTETSLVFKVANLFLLKLTQPLIKVIPNQRASRK